MAKYVKCGADVIVHVSGGLVQDVELPPGFAGRIVVMDYDGEGAADWEDENLDGEPCNIAMYESL